MMKTPILIASATAFAAFEVIAAPLAIAAPSHGPRAVKETAVAPTPLEAGADYFGVRTWLIKQGWKPVITGYKFRNDPDYAFGEERLYWKRGAVEAETCYGDAPGGCVTHFKRGAVCLRIQTKGEYVPNVAHPYVEGWDHKCVGRADLPNH